MGRLNITYMPKFIRMCEKFNKSPLRLNIRKIIDKIKKNPEIGKPMQYGRKGSREVYMDSFRVSYAYIKKEVKIIFLSIYHKDKQ